MIEREKKTYRLAIVEDEAIVAHSIEQKLTKLGYEVGGVFCRAEMLLSFLQNGGKIDLILMDVQLQGGMSGLEAAAEILRLWRVPVVYLTAFSNDATLEKAAQTEPYGYLIKPFNDRELKATVEMALYKAEVIKELIYRQARWEAIFFHIRDGLVVTDIQGRIVSVNPAMKQLTGLDDSFMVGKSLDDLFTFSHQAGRKENYVLLKEKNGTKCLPVYWDSSVIVDNYGKKLGTVYICRDVREILEYEEALAKSEENYRTLVENQGDWIVKIGSDGTFLYVNDAMAEALGWEKHLLIGQNFFDIIPEQERVEWQNLFASLHESSEEFSREMAFVKQGVKYVIEWRFSCIDEKTNKHVCKEIYGIGRDITLLRETEEALREEDEFLKRILMAIEEGVIILDESGKIEFANPRGREMIGLDSSVDKNFLEVVKISRQNKEIETDFASFIQQILSWPTGVWVLMNQKQRRYEVMIDLSILQREDMGKTEFVLLLTDLTLFNQLQQEFYRAQRLEAMEILAGGIAHDFNNLLTVILGNLSLIGMRFGEHVPGLLNYVNEAESACERAKQLTQQMLSFSRGGTPVIRQENIIQVIVDTTKFILQGSAVQWRFEQNTKRVSIPVDLGQFTQVIQNLVLNAREAMKDKGKLVIAVNEVAAEQVHRRVAEPLPGVKEYFCIIIRDNGPGIPVQILPRIFDPYVSTKARGSGLGLAIVYAIVYKHHGLIEIDSEEGKGTEFRVYFPIYDVENEQKTLLLSLSEKTKVSGRGRRAWILDDEVGIVRVLEKSLRQREYETLSFQKVEDFMKKVGEISSEDVVIMDITLPGEISVEERLKNLFTRVPDVHVVLISGYAKKTLSFPEGKKVFFLAKPFTIQDLFVILEKIFQSDEENTSREVF